jgi:peptidoglycan hydrolase-like amidase
VNIDREPELRVGLIDAVREARFTLSGRFEAEGGTLVDGDHVAVVENATVNLAGLPSARKITLAPADFSSCRFTVHGVKIGIDFHWERLESQQFQGKLTISAEGDRLTIINELPLESYLISVISSEMSASCPVELLRAHAIVSRSWLLSQLQKNPADLVKQVRGMDGSSEELIRWYDRESHKGFDVCADDHCQRYQGIGKAFSLSAFEAVRDTSGKALVYQGEICDTRYSKSCGGMTEVYRAAWEEKEVPYLSSIYDGLSETPQEYQMPLTFEENAESWITGSPPACCGMVSPELLSRIVPDFDQETSDSFRWRVHYSQDELGEILQSRYGLDFGRIRELKAIERGSSGRIIKLKINGEKRSLVIGKELEIRRALSRSHLYSSAFVVRSKNETAEYPTEFTLIGAGWGHGVGLCQIGAAVLADRGSTHAAILSHYFKSAELISIY